MQFPTHQDRFQNHDKVYSGHIKIGYLFVSFDDDQLVSFLRVFINSCCLHISLSSWIFEQKINFISDGRRAHMKLVYG